MSLCAEYLLRACKFGAESEYKTWKEVEMQTNVKNLWNNNKITSKWNLIITIMKKVIWWWQDPFPTQKVLLVHVGYIVQVGYIVHLSQLVQPDRWINSLVEIRTYVWVIWILECLVYLGLHYMASIDSEDCKNLLNLQNCWSLEYGSPRTKLWGLEYRSPRTKFCIICA